MRILLDSCVYGSVAPALVGAGHDIEWVGRWARDPGDEEILRYANHNQRVVITIDKDFGRIAILGGIKHRGIVRLSGLSARQQAPAAVAVLADYGDELTAGAIVTVEPGRVRVRTGPE